MGGPFRILILSYRWIVFVLRCFDVVGDVLFLGEVHS